MSNKIEDSFNDFVKEMEEKEQPTSNIDNQEDCDSCGS